MGKRILLLEPEEEIRRFLIEKLQDKGYGVSSPIDSYAGLEYAQTEAFDLVMLNARMPIIDGGDFLSCLREQNIGIPAVVFFRTASECTPFAAHSSCISVQKPFQIDALLQQIEQIMNTE